MEPGDLRCNVCHGNIMYDRKEEEYYCLQCGRRKPVTRPVIPSIARTPVAAQETKDKYD